MFLGSKKYDLVRSGSMAGDSGGQYRRLNVSPTVRRDDTLLQISATDSHESSFIASLAFEATIGRMANRPLHSTPSKQSVVRVRGKGSQVSESHIYLRGIGFIPREWFESLPESKVDPDVAAVPTVTRVPTVATLPTNPDRAYAHNVCQTQRSIGTRFTPDSHSQWLQLNNSRTTSDHNDKQFPCFASNKKNNTIARGYDILQESTVFTLIGRQITKPEQSVAKPNSLSRSSGTLFGVSATPKTSRRETIVKSGETTETTQELNEKLNSTNSAKQSTDYNICQNKEILLKVSANEKLNSEQSVPQEVPTETIKQFCRVMTQEKDKTEEVKPLDNNCDQEVNREVHNDRIASQGSPTLKSPSIVKEVMKRMAILSSDSSTVDYRVSETKIMDSFAKTNGLSGGDTEAMLVIQELDRSIAEASPSTANSPLNKPRIHEKLMSNAMSSAIDNAMDKLVNRACSETALTNRSFGFRPTKPPRLVSTSIEAKHKTMIEVNETQTDNLIEELYVSDDNGSKLKFKIDSPDMSIGHKVVNPLYNVKLNNNYIESSKNRIDLNISNDMKQMSGQVTNDLDGTVICQSSSSIDSGTSSPNVSHFIVVAIDFGTTFSGYSFAFTRDVDNAIHMMRKVEGCDPDVSNQKIPTVLLLNPDGQFHSFGFAARDFYSNLEPKDAKKWFYFEKFKMNLHYDESLSLHTKIRAMSGNKSVSALTVFAHALRYFKQLALRELTDQTAINIVDEDIRWVITVPAIWKPSAKQFMRAAAYEAGIGSTESPNQLLIALEPEAASIYCRKLKLNQLVPLCPPRRHTLSPTKSGTNENLMAVECNIDNTYSVETLKRSLYNNSVESSFTEGTKYIVVDVGGGTVDITCHQIQTKEGSLKELYKAMGGPNGSIGVDANFERLLSDIFGEEYMNQFKTKRPAGYVDLMAAFEARKRSASPNQTTTSNISLPFSFINFFRKTKGMSVENAVKKYTDMKGISYCPKLGMLRIEADLVQQLFTPITQKIISHIWNVLNHQSLQDVTYLFLVGGFAESPILQTHIRNAFSPQLKVIIPQSPNLAILRGATLYGLDPTIISCRRARLTYGVGVLNRFIRGKHPLHKLAIKDGIEWCADIFDKFVVCDQSIGLFESITRSYTPVNSTQTCSIIHIFCTDKEEVQFVSDDGVQRCGTLYLDLEPIEDLDPNAKREIRTQMIFGDTEIKVCALDVRTKKCVKAEIDFLNN